MTRRLLLTLAAVALLASIPSTTEAQGAACTGTCWQTGNTPYCGFTAFQEGGKCTILYDPYGFPFCVVWSCSGGGGWVPENQGLLPWLVEPPVPIDRTVDTKVTVTVIAPRT